MPLATYAALDGLGNPIATITFTLLLSAAGRTADAEISKRHVPGGDNNFIDVGGQLLPMIDGEGMFIDYATLITMEGLRGTNGTLAYTEDTLGTAVTLNVLLDKVGRRNVTGRGPQYAAVTFTILT